MRELSYDEFVVAWSTYWGRREIGFVLENSMATQIASNPRSLHTFYGQWTVARAAFPESAALRLMGTPTLTPELWATTSPPSVSRPPAPLVGRYALDDPAGSGLSDAAGDYTSVASSDPKVRRLVRVVWRGNLSVFLATATILLAGVPLLALPLAVLSLVWATQADRALKEWHPRRRARWLTTAGQVVSVVSILFATVLLLSPQPTAPSASREEFAMSHPMEGTLSGDIVARILTHWPDAQVSVRLADGDPALPPEWVRVRVADRAYLDAIPGETAWSVRPMQEVDGQIVSAEPSHIYTIGVSTAEGAEAIADRFYEEVQFWWFTLNPHDISNEQSA